MFSWMLHVQSVIVIRVLELRNSRVLSIQPKILPISVGISNGTDRLGLVRPEYSGPALKVVHCDRSGNFGQLVRNIPFHLTNCCPQYRSFVSWLQKQKPNARCPGSGLCNLTVPFHWAREISDISNR